MTRKAALIGLAALAGCNHAPPEPPPTAAAPTAPAAVPAPPTAPRSNVLPSGEIDFAGWPAATGKPYRMEVANFVPCSFGVALPPITKYPDVVGFGPHDQPAIIVRINPEAIGAFKSRQAPLPVGTVVVKEKHATEKADGPPNEYGAMVRREPGYDPEHGDWEYVYVTRKPVLMITRGKVASCIDCHAKAKDKDFLFRTYLPGTNPGEW